MAARIIVRRELLDVIGQAYPMLNAECRQQFRDEWNRWHGMERPRGSRAPSIAPSLVGIDQSQ
jgi:hypothetical protein